jgi:hypothetical protein
LADLLSAPCGAIKSRLAPGCVAPNIDNKEPPMAALPRNPHPVDPSTRSGSAAVADFLDQVAMMPPPAERGRLIFALDATLSRQPTWDLACRLQGEMFREAGRIGGLDVQLVYFRGFGECRASRWATDAERLGAMMTRIDCRGGRTQIGRVLWHALNQTRRQRVGALVYVGDAMEESADVLCGRAGELALSGTPVFVFQEGHDPGAERVFRDIARITRGAWCRFDASAAHELAVLLRAVAAYAAGGREALAALSAREGAGASLLLQQIGGA